MYWIASYFKHLSTLAGLLNMASKYPVPKGWRFYFVPGQQLCILNGISQTRAISMFMICYTVAIYALAKPITGWTTTILLLAVAFLGLFGILTIIKKYLQILADLNFKRTKYSFKSIEKLTK